MNKESKLRDAADIMHKMASLVLQLSDLCNDESFLDLINSDPEWTCAWAALSLDEVPFAMWEAEEGFTQIADRDDRDADELHELLHARFFQTGPIEAVRDLVRRRYAENASYDQSYAPAQEIAAAFFREVFEDVIGRPWIDENPRIRQWNVAVVDQGAYSLTRKIGDSFRTPRPASANT